MKYILPEGRLLQNSEQRTSSLAHDSSRTERARAHPPHWKRTEPNPDRSIGREADQLQTTSVLRHTGQHCHPVQNVIRRAAQDRTLQACRWSAPLRVTPTRVWMGSVTAPAGSEGRHQCQQAQAPHVTGLQRAASALVAVCRAAVDSDTIADQCAYCGTYEVGISPCFEL